MELKEGMYVRIKNGRIAKYLGKEEEYEYHEFDNDIIPHYEYHDECLWLEDFDEWFKNDLLKSSYNIIDLIEVGDYVNGSKLLSIDYAYDRECNCDKTHFYYSFENDENDVNEYYENLKIKSIVTKEQFEQMEYKING